MYGKIINGVLYVVSGQKDGWKPFAYTEEPEAQEGYHTAYIWVETEDSFNQQWETIEDHEEDIDDSEALNILLGLEGGDVE